MVLKVRASFIITLLILLSYTSIVNPATQRRQKKGSIHNASIGSLVKFFKNNQFSIQLGLPVAKINKIIEILDAAKTAITPVNKKLSAERKAYREAYKQTTINPDRVLSIYRNINSLLWQKKEIEIRAKVKFLNMISQNERNKLGEVYKKYRSERRASR